MRDEGFINLLAVLITIVAGAAWIFSLLARDWIDAAMIMMIYLLYARLVEMDR